MKEVLDNLAEGKLWVAFLLSAAPSIISYFQKDYNANPRQKYLPVWFAGVVLGIIVLNLLQIISIQSTWIFIVITITIFIYIYVINKNINLSYEKILAGVLKKKLINSDIDNYDQFYEKNKKLFITHLGKYVFGLSCLDFLSQYGIYPLCFGIMDDIQKLKLTRKEKRILYIKQFAIYCETQALKFWENKYGSIKELFNEEDKLFIESIMAFHQLDLKSSEEKSQKLLAITSNESYKQIAENNLAVISENSLLKTDWSDFIHKSFTSSENIKSNTESNIDITTLNLIYYYLRNEKIEKADELFQKYIKKLPNKTANQRIKLTNIRLEFFRHKNDIHKLNEVIDSLYNEYTNTKPPANYPILISLLRISFNHQHLFEESLTEVERLLDEILNSDFSLIRWITNEIFAIEKSPYGLQNQNRVINLVNKCVTKVNSIDIDKEIAKLRIEEVATKRSYIKFKSELSTINLINPDFNQFEKQLHRKFKILDELIEFDEKQGIALNILDSLFLKLDEVTFSIDMIVHSGKIHSSTTIINELNDDGYSLISSILKIMQKAEDATIMTEHHLHLAHYYCCLNNIIEGYKHFLKFKKKNVSLLNYASWLQERYRRLENYFAQNKLELQKAGANFLE